ncbi:hypothetical protein NBRC116596_14760 [Litorivita sp. NS0012-18]
MPPALRRAVQEAGFADDRCRWIPLSGGRSNRLWQLHHGRGDAASTVVKLFAAPDGNPLFANDPDREARILARLEGLGIAPRLRAQLHTPEGRALLYDHVEGAPWCDDPAPVAHLLRHLHRSGAAQGAAKSAGLPAAPDGSAALARQTSAILALCPGDARARLAPFLDRLAARAAVPPLGARALLHGDPVAGNLIAGPNGLRLIDWQCPALGDPCEDIAHFLSPAMQIIYRGAALSRAQEQGFLAALNAPDLAARYAALAPWYHARMAAYCAWQIARGQKDYAAAEQAETAALKTALR